MREDELRIGVRSVRVAVRAVGFALAVFFMVLAVSLARQGIILTFFFTESGMGDASFEPAGLIILLYAAVFAMAALLTISSGSYPRVWLAIAVLALPLLALTAMGGYFPSPVGAWASAGLVLILAFAAVRIARSRSAVT